MARSIESVLFPRVTLASTRSGPPSVEFVEALPSKVMGNRQRRLLLEEALKKREVA